MSDVQKQVYNVQLAQAQIAVERAQRNLVEAKLLSPCSCVVQDVTLTAGSASANGSITLLDRSQVQFRTTNLGERDVVNVHAGQAVTIRLKAFDQTFSGKVLPWLHCWDGARCGVLRNPKCPGSWRIRFLNSSICGKRLEQWHKESIAELRDAFDARAGVYRAVLDQGQRAPSENLSESDVTKDLFLLENWAPPQ